MDRYLFEQFVFEMEEDLYDKACLALAKEARNTVKVSNVGKITFNYYPPEPSHLQFVVEGFIDNNSAQLCDVKVHHVSPDVWKLRIVTPISECDGSYLATRPDGNGLVAIRLVNEHVLGDIKPDIIIEAQMVAFALNVNIYQDDVAYKNSVRPDEIDKKILMKDGLVVATDYLANNSANLTDEERQNREHGFDNLVDICGTITNCNKFPLHMFGTDLSNYYMANVMTDYGQIKIIIAQTLLPEGVEGFGVGNIIVGKVMLSGDVCIYDYDKYVSPMTKTSDAG